MTENLCHIEMCGATVVAKGLCNRHYKQQKRTGVVEPKPCRLCGEPAVVMPGPRLCMACRTRQQPAKPERIRICKHCGGPVAHKGGPLVCVDCRKDPNQYGKKGIKVGPRVCGLCGVAEAAHTTGPPRCAECKRSLDLQRGRISHERICWRCGEKPAAQPKGRPVCADCLRDYSRPEPVERSCPTCGKTSVRTTRLCSSCYHDSKKHPCELCGDLCDKRARVCLKCLSTTAPTLDRSNNWRGGRTRHKTRGYVRVRVPGHPRAADGYVPEHILVMEGVIGRYLLPGENVHHKNGTKDDNRPENLELWAKTQPAGQRAVDLLAWAREIIDRYQPVEGQLHLFD